MAEVLQRSTGISTSGLRILASSGRSVENDSRGSLLSDFAQQGKILLHIDQSGRSDPLPFGSDGGPHVIVRVKPISMTSCE